MGKFFVCTTTFLLQWYYCTRTAYLRTANSQWLIRYHKRQYLCSKSGDFSLVLEISVCTIFRMRSGCFVYCLASCFRRLFVFLCFPHIYGLEVLSPWSKASRHWYRWDCGSDFLSVTIVACPATTASDTMKPAHSGTKSDSLFGTATAGLCHFRIRAWCG